MPDRRRHRGKHPDDDRLFAPEQHAALRQAVDDYCWLLGRGYAVTSALKIVGDHFGLAARQRLAVQRSSCSDEAVLHRRRSMTPAAGLAGRALGIDGYNVLITIESALSGGVVLIGRDGCYRDLASLHGTYRQVDETLPAVDMVVETVLAAHVMRVDWYLDRPVSNSGRLRKRIRERIEQERSGAAAAPEWNVELAESPDALLAAYDGVIATSDSVVLDRCRAWVNLAAEIIGQRVGQAWTLDLRAPGPISAA